MQINIRENGQERAHSAERAHDNSDGYNCMTVGDIDGNEVDDYHSAQKLPKTGVSANYRPIQIQSLQASKIFKRMTTSYDMLRNMQVKLNQSLSSDHNPLTQSDEKLLKTSSSARRKKIKNAYADLPLTVMNIADEETR